MTTTVGIREFRSGLADYIDSDEPVEVTRRGQVVGVFLPMSRPRSFDAAAFVEDSGAMRAELAAAGVDPEDIIREFDDLRHGRA